MYVSGYNTIVDDLLAKLDDKGDEAPARKLEERVAKLLKKAANEAYDDVFDVVRDCLLSNMEDAIRDAARRLAEQYVKSALAGDEKTFGDMFEWRHDWKGAYFHSEHLPLGVKLRRQLLEKHHDLFESKVIADLEGELAALKRVRNLRGWRTMVEGDL
jgi:hypothetical protein